MTIESMPVPRSGTKRKSVMAKFRFAPCDKAGKYAAIYVRVSSDAVVKIGNGKTEDRASVTTQKADLKDYADKRDWTSKVYDADCDISGAEDIKNRPALKQLKADIEAGLVHTVLVRESKRLFRDQTGQADFVSKVLLPYGVGLESPFESIDIFNRESRFMLGFKSYIAEGELFYSSEKSKRCKDERAEEGTLRTKPAYGYEIVESKGVRSGIIKEPEAEIIRKLFDWYIAGKGIVAIVRLIEKEGVRTSKNTPWNVSQVRRALTNPIYGGKLCWNGKLTNSPFPAIIPADKWLEANNRLKDIRQSMVKPVKKSHHLLTGILRCGYCGTGYCHTKNTKQAKDKKYVYYGMYRCLTHERFGEERCKDSIAIHAERIEKLIVDWVGNTVVQAHLSKREDGSGQIEALEGRVKELEAKIAKMKMRQQEAFSMFANGDIDASGLASIQTKGKQGIVKAETELYAANDRLSGLANDKLQTALESVKGWDSLDGLAKKEGLKGIFSKILVFNDHLEFCYNGNASSFDIPIVSFKNGIRGYSFDVETAMKQLTRTSGYRFSQAKLPE